MKRLISASLQRMKVASDEEEQQSHPIESSLLEVHALREALDEVISSDSGILVRAREMLTEVPEPMTTDRLTEKPKGSMIRNRPHKQLADDQIAQAVMALRPARALQRSISEAGGPRAGREHQVKENLLTGGSPFSRAIRERLSELSVGNWEFKKHDPSLAPEKMRGTVEGPIILDQIYRSVAPEVNTKLKHISGLVYRRLFHVEEARQALESALRGRPHGLSGSDIRHLRSLNRAKSSNPGAKVRPVDQIDDGGQVDADRSYWINKAVESLNEGLYAPTEHTQGKNETILLNEVEWALLNMLFEDNPQLDTVENILEGKESPQEGQVFSTERPGWEEEMSEKSRGGNVPWSTQSIEDKVKQKGQSRRVTPADREIARQKRVRTPSPTFTPSSGVAPAPGTSQQQPGVA